MLALVAAAALGSAAAPALHAQTARPHQLLDRIVAVVGDRAILLSEIDEEINTRQSEGLQVPEDSVSFAALRRQVLEGLIDEEVLYQRARRDTTITVTDAEVQSAVDQQVRDVRARFSSDVEFRTALAAAGMGTVEEYRRRLAEQQRRAAYQQRYVEKLRNEQKLRGPAVSEAEVRAAFESAQQTLQRRPPTLTFRQIIVAPLSSPAERAAARTLAESVLVEVRHGADFATMARRHSDDPGSRESGGDLNWFRRGIMTREFEDVAFRLRPGQISDLVETRFGYHIILVERVQPGEVKARHILFTPAIADSELAAAHSLADTIAAHLRGGADFDSLATLYADTSEPRQQGPVDRGQLPAPYVAAFEGAVVGEVVGAFAMNPETPARSRFVVAVVTDVQPERPYTLDEARETIRSGLQQNHAIRELYRTLRRQTYVDIRL